MKDSSEISFSGPRSGVSMITDKSVRTVVTLILALATVNDSGTYSCCPSTGQDKLPVGNISVNVLMGDKTAELSGQQRPVKSFTTNLILVLALSIWL